MLRRRQLFATSGIVFAAIFVISAVLGDGMLNGGKATTAAAKQVEEQVAQIPLPDTLVPDSALFLEEEETEGMNQLQERPQLASLQNEELTEDTNTEESSVKQEKEEAEEKTAEGKTSGKKTEAEKAEDETAEETAAEETATKEKTEEAEKKAASAEKKEKEKTTVDYVIANVDSSLNIRKKPSTEAEIVGKLYRGAKATIVKRGKNWTKIKSGSVKGYVASEYLMFDEEAEKGAEIFGVKIATVQTETLRIRKEPGTDAPVLDLVAEGERLVVADTKDSKKSKKSKKSEDSEKAEWIAIDYSEEEIGYVAAEYVSLSVELEEAISIEEEQRLLEEKRREEAAAQAAKNGNTSNGAVATTARGGISVSADDAYLMAAVVYMEAGNQSYAGQLAVANVIINRLLSGLWGNSINSVVYAPGQFSGAATGLLQRYLNQGPSSSCINAVADALAGNNNIGNYMFFCTNRVANYSSYSYYTIIGDHCFYQR